MAFLGVEILHFSLLEVGGFKGVHRPIGSIQHDAVDHVSELAPIERLALAGFCKLEIDDDIRFFINEDLETLSQSLALYMNPIPFFVRSFAILGEYREERW